MIMDRKDACLGNVNDEVHSVRGCIGTDILLAATMHIWIAKKRIKKWTHWDLNPGPSACEADVMPLHHAPVYAARPRFV